MQLQTLSTVLQMVLFVPSQQKDNRMGFTLIKIWVDGKSNSVIVASK